MCKNPILDGRNDPPEKKMSRNKANFSKRPKKQHFLGGKIRNCPRNMKKTLKNRIFLKTVTFLRNCETRNSMISVRFLALKMQTTIEFTCIYLKKPRFPLEF